MQLSPRGQTSPLVLVTLVLVAGVAASALGRDSRDPPAESDVCASPDSQPVRCPSEVAEAPGEEETLTRAACVGAGYLCASLTEEQSIRILRWGDGREPLSIHVSLPDHEDPAHAVALQRAAVRGIQAWQGKPFPLRILDRPDADGAEADIRVTWARQLDGSALGTTRTRWETNARGASFTSVSFVLATRSPFLRERKLTPDELELVAAHEMGHALGLPHSDQEGDLMFPQNTASSLSARDYRTMEALYRLPNGATIGNRSTRSD